MNQTPSDTSITIALNKGLSNYFSETRERIDPFIKRHFRYPGAWSTNKIAWGWDILRAPINLIWAPFYIVILLLSYLLQNHLLKIYLFKKIGFGFLAKILKKTPSGLTTSVQRYITSAIHTDLLQKTDIYNANNNGPGEDRLAYHLNAALTEEISLGEHYPRVKEIEKALSQATTQYANTRTASADVTNSLLAIIGGAFAFQKFTPGGLAIGLTLATLITNQLAIDNFIFGEYLGEIFYSLFPKKPSTLTSIASAIGVITVFSLLAPFSGLITDPIQSWTGLHKRRLIKLIDHLEKDALEQSQKDFNPKDQYVARILDVLDAAKAQIG
ncbi:MAG: hypothetical protein K6L75_13250 [Cellvibrionaceae bacterium]